MAKVQTNYDSLLDFIVREQFIVGCHDSLAVFLREQKPKDGKEIIKLAERYLDAHGAEISRLCERGNQRNKMRSDPITRRPGDQKKSDKGNLVGVPIEERVCYKCRKTGHIARDCTSPEPPRPDNRV